MPKVVTELPYSETPPEKIREDVNKHIEDIINALTKPIKAEAKRKEAEGQLLRFEGGDFYDALDTLGRGFLERGWGDGFPIVPATPEAVDKMLGGTSRMRDEVVTVLEPGRGLATVEKIAINSVMAGCKPQHLPVIITAVEAMMEPAFDIRYVAQSTGPHCPFLIVNGPIVKELGINYEGCCLGPGSQSWVNTVIGRAIRLIMMNVGHTYPGRADNPGRMDNDVIGSPNKYSMCVGENEDENPWEPLHVERGFSRDTSTVSVFPVTSYYDISDLGSDTPEGVLTTFAHSANNAGAFATRIWLAREGVGANMQNLMVLTPGHANTIKEAGWTKNDIRRFMFQKSLLPWGVIKGLTYMAKEQIAPEHRWLLDEPPERMVPIVRDPSYFQIIVAGKGVGKSGYCIGTASLVTREIKS
ncbi:hypothetical protein ACFLWC_07915 [Chloroflexota bacterium]